MPPLAVILKPSSFPYQFTEVTQFQGDFDETVRPGEVVNPKGIAYHPELDRLIVSISPHGTPLATRSQNLTAVARNGSRRPFAPDYHSFRAVESKIAIVPQAGAPVEFGGFTPGEIFIGRGPESQISRLDKNGNVLADVWADLNTPGGLWGGITFDTGGEFGGQLIAATTDGKIFFVNGNGQSFLFRELNLRVEGLTVAPATFGPMAKHLLVSIEGWGDFDVNGGEIYALSAEGELTLLANIGYAAEDLNFVPPQGGTYYQCELSFERERENRLFCVSSSQFLNRLGRLVVVNEMTGELIEVAWDGSRYTQEPVGRVPGRWSSTGFNAQGTELEQACFAVNAPVVPDWTNWDQVPGNLTTTRAPAATAAATGDLLVFTNNAATRSVYTNRFSTASTWRGWRETEDRLVTLHALGSSLHNSYLYALGVRTPGNIVYKLFDSEGEEGSENWQTIPGVLNATTAVCAATVNGRMVVAALGDDQGIYLNELAPGGRYWSGWYQIPGGGRTNVTPCVASFQDELWVFIKGLTSKRILVKARSVDGVWTPWAELPGNGRTDAALSACAAGGQLFVFMKQAENFAPFVNVASVAGNWSGWLPLPRAGQTDTSLAPAGVEGRVYLFAKGVDDRRVYMRTTM